LGLPALSGDVAVFNQLPCRIRQTCDDPWFHQHETAYVMLPPLSATG
jgi:hypothetical protein